MVPVEEVTHDPCTYVVHYELPALAVLKGEGRVEDALRHRASAWQVDARVQLDRDKGVNLDHCGDL